jgi:hypothetical protein
LGNAGPFSHFPHPPQTLVIECCLDRRASLLANLRYDSHVMAKLPSNFELTCPCCSALLKVDVETQAVIAHTAAVKPRMFNDMEDAARAMKEQDSRRESIFRQSVEAQKNASDVLEKKFQEAVRKAKETPDTGRPIRDFDLD